MTDQVVGSFLQLGVGYTIALMLGIACVFLFKKLMDKDKVVENRDEIIAVLQEKRVSEAEKRSEIVQSFMTTVSSPISKILESQEAFTRFIENYTWKKK